MKRHVITLQDSAQPSVVCHVIYKCSCNMQKPYAYESNKTLRVIL